MEISKIYENLYHYTTWGGLQGILATQSLWATHYKFLNDYSEIVLMREKLISFLEPFVHRAYLEAMDKKPKIKEKIKKEGGLGKVIEHDTRVTVDAQYEAIGEEIYILSFCGQNNDDFINKNGLLSQWRGYGVDGGVCIVFDTKKLEDIFEFEVNEYEYSMIHLSDIIYSDDKKKFQSELSDDMRIISKDVENMFSVEHLGGKLELKGFYSFVKCISSYKHCGFKEENEVRAVAMPTVFDNEFSKHAQIKKIEPKKEKGRKFRKYNGIDIPYIELFESQEAILPIKKIIIGPHKDKEVRAAFLRVMLRKTDIEISVSEIPFAN